MNIEFIVCTETKNRFLWEVAVQLNNARKLEISDKFTYLLFTAIGKEPHKNVELLKKKFPEVNFVEYEDKHDIYLDVVYANYPPLSRLYMLRSYFKAHPELKDKPIFYLDSDVLFQNTSFIEPLLNDNINYLSDTKGYMGKDYWESKYKLDELNPGKPKFVKEELFHEFKLKDILGECSSYIGLDKKTIIENDNKCGGAQYILKGVDAKFWGHCYMDCITIRQYLRKLNQQYMKGENPTERENNGFQSWCSDMFSVLWNLYKKNMPIETPKSMDFAWATDNIHRLSETNIFHNAGVTGDETIRTTKKDIYGNAIFVDSPAFFKGKYSESFTPFEDIESLNKIINNPISSTFCTAYYSQQILNTKTNLNL